MKYHKPDVTLLAPAISAIQSCATKGTDNPDNQSGCGSRPTNGAYEADE